MTCAPQHIRRLGHLWTPLGRGEVCLLTTTATATETASTDQRVNAASTAPEPAT